MTCRVCGCSDFDACVTVRGDIQYVCWWAEPGLCSFCALNATTDYRVPVRGVDDVWSIGGIL